MKSKSSFQKLIENIPEVLGIPILLSGREGKILYANSSAQEALQDSFKNISKINAVELFKDIDNFAKYLKEAVSGKRIRIFDPIMRDQKGEKILLEFVEIDPLSSSGPHGQCAVISFRKRDESFVDKYIEKNEDEIDNYGIVWRGITHEVKNPLGGIKGAAQMLLRSLEENSPFRSHANVILREVERIDRFLDNLSSYEEIDERDHVDILKLITEALELIKSHISQTGKNIQLKLIADTSLPALYCDSDALFRTFINILKNSVEAIDDSGTIKVTLKLHEDLVLRAKDKSKNYIVEVEFYDNGKQLKEDEIPYIFHPFFTKKPGGTGMGLFHAKTNIKAQGGSIKVKLFTEGKAFKVYFPLMREEK